MSRSPSAIINNSIKVCNDATLVAKCLERQGQISDAKTIMRLVHWHANAARQLEKLRDRQNKAPD